MNELKQIKKQSRISAILRNVGIYFGLSLWAIAVLFPFYWMVQNSFKSFYEYNSESIPKFLPSVFTIENYIQAFTEVPLAQYLLNTLVFTITTTVIMLVVIILAAFAFARLDFKGKDLAFTLFLALMMIPNELVIITNYVTITNLELRNTLMGLVLPSVTSIFYLYLLKENFAQIPDELYLAAQIDGSNDFGYLMNVMVPISSPTIVTVLILKVIECWNSYMWPRLVTDDQTKFLVSGAIQAIRETGFGRDNIPAMMAAVVVISLPLIALFLVFKDRIMEGVSRGGTKG